jgi:hypothetical protein
MAMNLLSILLLCACMPLAARASSAGPPLAHTGAPGEANCTACHASFPINSNNGSFIIEGPVSFRANENHTITVRLQDPGQSRWGFELTTQGQGLISLLEPGRTQVSTAPNGFQYLRHTSLGTNAGTANGPVSWTFNWTAPAVPSTQVVFWAAGNAANNNLGSSGDYIYTTSLTVPLALDAVNDLTLTMDGTMALLAWSPVATATAYRVERASSMGAAWVSLGQVGSPGFLDLGAGTQALYRVVALR